MMDMSKLGYGCSAYWSHSNFSTEQSVKLVHHAYENGISYFDTGSSYGNAEERLGIALGDMPRSEIVVSSKAGTLDSGSKSFSVESIVSSVGRSIQRLNCDYLDIVYLHGPRIQDLEIGASASRKLIELGLTHKVGVNSFDDQVLRHTLKEEVFTHLMFEHNPLNHNHQLIADARQLNKTIITGTGVGQNLGSLNTLIPKDRKHLWYLLRALAKHPSNLVRSYFLKLPKDLDNLSRPQLFLLFQILNDDIASTVFGTTSIEHLTENVAVLKHAVSEETKHYLAHIAV